MVKFAMSVLKNLQLRSVRIFLVLSILIVLMIFYSTGFSPCASCGDQVWWSESASHFLKDGVLKRAIHNNDLNYHILDGYPPFAAIGQVISFKVFGLNQFSMMFMGFAFFSVNFILLWLYTYQLTKSSFFAYSSVFIFYGFVFVLLWNGVLGCVRTPIDRCLRVTSGTLVYAPPPFENKVPEALEGTSGSTRRHFTKH